MHKQLVKIKPLSPVFFRGGKPFPEEDGSWVASMPLPYPSVIWGSIFSSLLIQGKVTTNDIAKLRINRVWLFNEETGQGLVPAPLDLFKEKGKENYQALGNKRMDSVEVISSNLSPSIIQPNTDKEVINVDGLFLSIYDFLEEYLYENDGMTLHTIESFSTAYKKLGIARNKRSRSVQEGRLYQIEMREFNDDWAIAVEFEGPKLDNGILKLGGEGKLASVETLPSKYGFSLPQEENQVYKYLKLVILSPTFFKSGDGFAELSSLPSGLKLANACIGKALKIGGYDMKKKGPKPMRNAVPSGSVYILKNTADLSLKKVEELIKDLFNETEEDNRKGFNQYQIIPKNE